MAKAPEVITVRVVLVDTVAEALGYEVLNKAEFTKRVQEELISILAPRLRLQELEQKGVIRKVKS